MKKLRNLIAVMAMMSMAAVLTGCGDDDDDDDDDGGNGGPVRVAPATVEELTAANRTYTVTVPGDTNQVVLTFPAAGQYRIQQGEFVETGTFANAVRSDNSWTMNVAPDAGQDGSQAGVVRLDFSSGTEGTWTFTPDGGTAETGTFIVTTTGTGDNGGDNGGGGTGGLSGQTLQLTSGSLGEKFDFLNDTNVEYEDGAATGTYTWDATNRTLNVTLTSSNESFVIVLPSDSNIANVTYTAPNGEVQTYSPTYTLGASQ